MIERIVYFFTRHRDPQAVRLRQINDAKLGYLESMKAAEALEVEASAYRIQAAMLGERITRLEASHV